MNVPNGSLGHLISELILFAIVPAPLNPKEIHVHICHGDGQVLSRLSSQTPKEPRKIGDMTTILVWHVILVQHRLLGGETSNDSNQK